MKKRLLSVFLLATCLLVGCEATESTKRDIKTRQSQIEGLDRTISVYSSSGKLLKEYHGKVDIEDNDAGNKVMFDNDGKRFIIYGGTVIIEEN